jgi:ABC-type sugar transport system substrate-binding protein
MLIDNTVANWPKQQAHEKVKGILQHTDVDIIWSANDAMAFGAKKAIIELNLTHKIVLGGINWDIANEDVPIDLSYSGYV